MTIDPEIDPEPDTLFNDAWPHPGLRKATAQQGIFTLGNLANFSEHELLAWDGFDNVAINEMRMILFEKELSFRDDS